ncbi:hypothetical protein Tco_0140066 [Tanacetum coccineum]
MGLGGCGIAKLATLWLGKVMAISVILISSNSLDESAGSSPSRIILFGTILAEIPVETPTIPPVVSTLPHTSLFLYTDSSNSDTSKRPLSQDLYEVIVARWRSRVVVRSSPPSSPTHDLPPVFVTPSTVRQILPIPPRLPYRPTVLILPGQPIPFDRPYHTQPNGVRKTLTTRKRVRALPSGRLVSRYPSDHSSSDHFSLDDSSSDYSLDSSSGALSFMHADLLPPRKRIRGAVTASDYDDSIEESYEAYAKPDIDFDVQADINADTAVAKTAMALEINIRIEADVGVEVGIRIEREDEVKSWDRGTIKIGVDRVSDIESAQREQGRRMLAASEQRAGMLDRIGVLERDNMRLIVGTDAAYAMMWKALMKLITEELVLLCTKMVPVEEDKVEKFIRVLPDNIQGNVITTEPIRLQDVIRIANNLMDQKLKGYAARNAENKRRFKNNLRDNRVKQQPFKRQNVARAYTVGNSEKKGC